MNSIFRKASSPFFEISVHSMMKHQEILCTKKPLRFIAAVPCLIVPEGNFEFYLLYNKSAASCEGTE